MTQEADPISWTSLPESASHTKLQALDGGSFIADWVIIHAGVESEKFRMYDFAFHISHPPTGRHVLWDLGVSSDFGVYTPWVQKFMLSTVQHTGPRRTIPEQLVKQGTSPAKVDSVIFSHAHWDHCRPIRNLLPQAKGFFGPGTREFCTPGHLVDSEAQWDGQFFDPEKSTENWEELSGPWEKFGPFDKAMDFFGDGSFWVMQAPGHMPGNLCAAARLEDGEWVILGSDCCHSRALFDGTHDFALWDLPNGTKGCLMADIPAARNTISKLKIMEQKFGAHIALAHDTSWIQRGSDKVLMSLLDADLTPQARQRVSSNKVL